MRRYPLSLICCAALLISNTNFASAQDFDPRFEPLKEVYGEMDEDLAFTEAFLPLLDSLAFINAGLSAWIGGLLLSDELFGPSSPMPYLFFGASIAFTSSGAYGFYLDADQESNATLANRAVLTSVGGSLLIGGMGGVISELGLEEGLLSSFDGRRSFGVMGGVVLMQSSLVIWDHLNNPKPTFAHLREQAKKLKTGQPNEDELEQMEEDLRLLDTSGWLAVPPLVGGLALVGWELVQPSKLDFFRGLNLGLGAGLVSLSVVVPLIDSYYDDYQELLEVGVAPSSVTLLIRF